MSVSQKDLIHCAHRRSRGLVVNQINECLLQPVLAIFLYTESANWIILGEPHT